MDFSALNNPDTTSQKISWWVVGGLTVLALGDAVTPGFPFPGSAFVMVPLAGAAWVKKAQEFGVFSGHAASHAGVRSNPIPLIPLLGIPLLLGTAALGTAAYFIYDRASDRAEVREAVEEDPFFSLVNPVMGAASASLIAYMKGVSVWKSALFGAGFGWAMRKVLLETMYAREGVATQPSDLLIDVVA